MRKHRSTILAILLISFFNIETLFASGKEQLDQPFLEDHRGLRGSVSRTSYEVKEGVLSIPITALDPNLLRSVDTKGISGLRLEEPKTAIVVTPENIQFIKQNFPALTMLHFASKPLARGHARASNHQGFVMSIVTVGEIGKLTNLLILRVHNCKLESRGVSKLSGLSRLVELDLLDNEVTDEGTEFFKNFPGLEVLSVANNRLTEACLVNLQYLENLKELYLGYNKIGAPKILSMVTERRVIESEGNVTLSETSISVTEDIVQSPILGPLASLRSLVKLDLRTAQDKGFITPRDLLSLAELVNLQFLDLSTQATGWKKEIRCHPRPLSGTPLFLESLKNLRELIANDSGIEDEGLKSIGKLTQLERLELDAGSIMSLDWEDSRKKPKIDFSGCFYQTKQGYPILTLNGTGLHHLLYLEKLKILNLKGHLLGDNANNIGNLTSLESLDLSNCFLTESSVALFSNLTNLVYLNLSSNNIRKGVSHLSTLHKVQVLKLDKNNIGDEGFSSLSRLEGLRQLDIGPSSWPYGLSPQSIPNIVAFVLRNKVERFIVSRPFFSAEKKEEVLANWERRGEREYYRHVSAKAVWERSDIERLFSQFPEGFDIPEGFLIALRGHLNSSDTSDASHGEPGKDCCTVS